MAIRNKEEVACRASPREGGYLRPVASKCVMAAPVPPEPSQFLRPDPMKPVERLSQRLVVVPDSWHTHFDGSGEIFFPFASCSRDAA